MWVEMNIVELTPQIIEEIEFYISSDETIMGLSISGLARLCGVPRKTLSDQLASINDPGGKELPETLKPLAGKVFTLAVSSVNGAKIIDSKAASRLIRYYAYEAKNKTQVAKTSYEKFAEIGINSWIKQVVGCNDNHNQSQVVALLNQLIEKVDRLESVTTEYNTIRGNTSVVFPNLDRMLEELKEEELPKITSGQLVSLNQWLLTKGVMLDRSSKHRLSLLVSETYKTTTGRKPNKKTIKIGQGRYQPNTCVYKEEEFPILEMSLRKLLGVN